MPPIESPQTRHAPSQRTYSLTLYAISAVAVTAALLWLWYLYTGQIWEDFLITLRFSKNAALGNGLVYTAGERIHGFTSPINVLLPAAILAVRPSLSAEAVLFMYNIVATILLGIAAYPVFKRILSETPQVRALAWIFLSLALGFNVKIAAFSTNGQEAAFTIAFLGMGLAALWREGVPSWKLLGESWGGLMWTRPDSPIVVAALGVAAVLFTTAPRRGVLQALLKSAALCTAIYLPWFVWVWSYYGSPVPHTIVAKQMYTMDVHGSPLFWISRCWSAFWFVLQQPFTPPYSECGGWSKGYTLVGRALTLLVCSYWLMPIRDRIGRTSSFVCFAWILFQTYAEGTARSFPWYYPAAGLTGTIVLLRLCAVLAERSRVGKFAALALGVGIIGFMGYGYVTSLEPTRLRQIHVENGVRRQVGLWLKEHVGVDERIYLEPIGYIGYFSERNLYDYPGLVSPKVVQTIRENASGFDSTIGILEPEWLVLRSSEAVEMEKNTTLLKPYRLEAVFGPGLDFDNIRKSDKTYALNSDLIFCILRRRTE